MVRRFSWCALVLLSACGMGQVGEVDSLQGAAAPLAGSAGDAADQACSVVLREVAPTRSASGTWTTHCSAGSCWYAWNGTVEVSTSALAAGDTVGMLYRGSDGTWRDGPAPSPTVGGSAGFARFSFQLWQGTVKRTTTAGLQTASLALIPYLRTRAGTRLFDHNRVPGVADSYRLDVAHAFSVPRDPAVCVGAQRAPAVLNFLSTFVGANREIDQRGALVAGSKATVSYDLNRLPGCFGSTYNGMPVWNTQGHVRFSPGGQQVEATVSGSPPVPDATGAFASVPWTLDIPSDATRAELWFENSGAHCSATWDSNLGSNYVFEVLPAAPRAVGWAGNWGGSLSRACTHADGLSNPLSVDQYAVERACMWADAEVWVPGLTDDLAAHSGAVWAEVEVTRDGGPVTRVPLTFVERVGNNYRYRWDFPRGDMSRGGWSTYGYAFRFSTDGVSWFRIGASDGPQGGSARTITSALGH